MKREDWAESWKRHFKPIEIRVKARPSAARQSASQPPSLLVKPSWSRRRAAKNQAVVILDPGLSFGTGQHPTTAFCLHEIARCRQPGTAQSFLDIGTGSGILAIAAAKLGYAPVQAFDFDPESVRVAGDNARKNRVTGRLKLTRGDLAKLPLAAGPAVRPGLRELDFRFAYRGKMADSEPAEAGRHAGAGGHSGGGICRCGAGVRGMPVEAALQPDGKRMAVWRFLFRLKKIEQPDNRCGQIM